MTSVPTSRSAPTRADVLQAVRDALAHELKLQTSGIAETETLDLLPGADSVRLMRVVANLEEVYGAEFDDDAVRSADTVADLTDLVFAEVGPAESKLWLPRPPPRLLFQPPGLTPSL